MDLTRRNMLKGSVAATTLLSSTSIAFMASAAAKPHQDVDAYIASLVDEFDLPGAGVAFVEDSSLAWHKSVGLMNVSTGQPVTVQTLFQAASLSKPVFAYVVLKAIENGELKLDDRLVDYYKPDDLVEDAFSTQVTVRDALQHTSGLPNWRDDNNGPDPLKLNYKPGSDSSYSGEAYHWLQCVMETITGQGLDTLMRERLFKPAGLEDMQMLWSPDRDHRETYYHEFDDEGKLIIDTLQYARARGWKMQEVAAKWSKPLKTWSAADQAKAAGEITTFKHSSLARAPSWYWQRPGNMMIDSASSLRCTPADYARFVALMLPKANRKSYEVSEDMRQMMLTPQYERPYVQNGVLPRGLGWGLEKRPEGVVCYHWGKNGPSHHAIAVGDPVTRKGIVVMAHGPKGKPFIREVVTTLMAKNYIGVIT